MRNKSEIVWNKKRSCANECIICLDKQITRYLRKQVSKGFVSALSILLTRRNIASIIENFKTQQSRSLRFALIERTRFVVEYF